MSSMSHGWALKRRWGGEPGGKTRLVSIKCSHPPQPGVADRAGWSGGCKSGRDRPDAHIGCFLCSGQVEY